MKKVVISIALVVIFLVSTIAFCSKPDKPTEEDIAAMVDSLVAFELEKIKSVEQAAPKVDSVAFAKAVADSVAQKESTFLALLREYATKSTLNVRKKSKVPERQGIQTSYEDDLWEQSWWDYTDYPYPLYGCVKSVGRADWNSIVYKEFNTRGNLSRESVPMSDSSDPSGCRYKYNAKNVLVGEYYIFPARPDIGFPGGNRCTGLAKKFDSRGNVVEWVEYHLWTSEKCTVKTKYNSNGKMIEKSEYEAEGNKTNKTTWKYNSKGKVIERVEYDAAGNAEKSTWKYNSRGDIIEVQGPEIREPEISRIACKYDKKGNRVEIAKYYDSETLASKKLLHYSKDGILVLTEKYNGKNVLEEVTFYSYDKRGNMIEKRMYNAIGKLLCKQSFKYDRMGNVIEVRVSPSSSGGEEDVFKYDITYYK